MTAEEVIALRQAQMIAVLDELDACVEMWTVNALAFIASREPVFPDIWSMPRPERPSLGIGRRIMAAAAGMSIGAFIAATGFVVAQSFHPW